MTDGTIAKKSFLTILHVKGVGGQSQCGVTVVTLEAAAMEELPLCTQPLHHVHTLPAEEANVAAADVDGELFPQRALWKDRALISVFIGKDRRGEERR